jgi:hypothetical protein
MHHLHEEHRQKIEFSVASRIRNVFMNFFGILFWLPTLKVVQGILLPPTVAQHDTQFQIFVQNVGL